MSDSGNLLARAFTVYLRPLVEYCSIVWSPCLKQDIEQLEKVQPQFTKRLHGLRCLPCKDRLCFIGLPSLHTYINFLQDELTTSFMIVDILEEPSFGMISVKVVSSTNLWRRQPAAR